MAGPLAPAHDAGMMPEMTGRSPAERPTACPFLAFEDDRDYRSDRPDHRHRCFAEARPAPRAISHQELFCLGGAFGECPTFAAWAAREAAAVKRPTVRATEASGAARGPSSSGRPASGQAVGFAAVGGAYATPPRPAPDTGPSAAPTPGTSRPTPEWQAPPPWISETADDATGDAQGPAYGRATSPYEMEGETPAFLVGRTQRPATGPAAAGMDGGAAARDGDGSSAGTRGDAAGAATPGMPIAAAGAVAVGAAAGSSAFIGGSWADEAEDGPGRQGPPAPAGGSTADSRTATPAPRSSASPYAQPVSGRAGGAGAGRRPTPSSDALWVEPDVDLPAEDEPWEDPVEAAAAARVARASRSSGSGSPRFGLGRSRSSSGQARPLPQRAADPAAPAWERPRRFEAYPTIKSAGGGRPGGRSLRVPRVLVWAGLLAVAALALFLIPPFLLGGGGGGSDASPTPSASAAVTSAPSVAPTPEPSPTPFTYKVKAGDTLSGIAAKYKVTVEDILAANPDLKDPNALQIGQVLVIPLPASSEIPDAGTTEQTAAP